MDSRLKNTRIDMPHRLLQGYEIFLGKTDPDNTKSIAFNRRHNLLGHKSDGCIFHLSRIQAFSAELANTNPDLSPSGFRCID